MIILVERLLKMSSETFYIKLDSHFRLWVQLKDKIAFEAALIKQGIPFHRDENQSTLGSDIRYFLLDKNRGQIDNVIKQISIIASTDTIPMYDIDIKRRVQKMYLTTVIVVVLLMGIAILTFG